MDSLRSPPSSSPSPPSSTSTNIITIFSEPGRTRVGGSRDNRSTRSRRLPSTATTTSTITTTTNNCLPPTPSTGSPPRPSAPVPPPSQGRLPLRTTPSPSLSPLGPRGSRASSRGYPPTPLAPVSSPPAAEARITMPFRDRVARRFGETVSSPASLSPHLPLPNFPAGFSPDPRVGTGSGRGLGCTRTRATARHDRMDCNGAGHGGGADAETLLRSTLGPQHRPGDMVAKSIGRTARAAGRRTTGNPCAYPSASSLSSSSPARRTSPRPRLPHATSSCTSFGPRRKYHTRVTRANCKMTDAHGNQLSPTAPYLSCESSPAAVTLARRVTRS